MWSISFLQRRYISLVHPHTLSHSHLHFVGRIFHKESGATEELCSFFGCLKERFREGVLPNDRKVVVPKLIGHDLQGELEERYSPLRGVALFLWQ